MCGGGGGNCPSHSPMELPCLLQVLLWTMTLMDDDPLDGPDPQVSSPHASYVSVRKSYIF